MKRAIFLISCLLMTTGCLFKNGAYVPDNIVEEIAEELIEAQLDIDIDLSPFSPEE